MDKLPEEIKLDNAIAQLAVVKGNIQVANDELGAVLVAKDQAEEALDDLIEDTKRLENKNRIAQEEIDAQRIELESKRLSIERLEEEHALKVASFNSFIEDKNREIEAKNNEALAKLEGLLEQADSAKVLLAQIEEKILEKQSLYTEVDINLEAVTNERNFVQDTLVQLKKDTDAYLGSMQETVATLRHEKEEIEKQIEEEKKKIGMPQFLLDQRIAAQDQREKNFDTLYHRFKKEFKKLHPDLEPKI